MLTVNDITSRCPVSVEPAYVVFQRWVPHRGLRRTQPWWSAIALIYDADAAIAFANGGGDQTGNQEEAIVCAMRPEEAWAIYENHLTFSDAEVAIYRSPYATAAE